MRLERQGKNKEEWDRFFFSWWHSAMKRYTSFPKTSWVAELPCSQERLKRGYSPVVPYKGFAAFAWNTIERFLTRGPAVSSGVCNAAGETGSLFSTLFYLLALFCFESVNPKPKPSNLGASGGLVIEGDLAFSWAPWPALGHFAISGNYSWHPQKRHLCGVTDM